MAGADPYGKLKYRDIKGTTTTGSAGSNSQMLRTQRHAAGHRHLVGRILQRRLPPPPAVPDQSEHVGRLVSAPGQQAVGVKDGPGAIV